MSPGKHKASRSVEGFSRSAKEFYKQTDNRALSPERSKSKKELSEPKFPGLKFPELPDTRPNLDKSKEN